MAEIKRLRGSNGIDVTQMGDRAVVSINPEQALKLLLPIIAQGLGLEAGSGWGGVKSIWGNLFKPARVANDTSLGTVTVMDFFEDVNNPPLNPSFFTAKSKTSYFYRKYQIVLLSYYSRFREWWIIDDFGTKENFKDLKTDAAEADTELWDAITETTYHGVQAEMHRTEFVTAENKIYDYNRKLSASNMARAFGVSAEERVQLLPNGIIDNPTELAGTGEAEDAADWDGQADKVGVEETYLSRMQMSLDDMKIYGYYRMRTYDSLGCLRSISGETRVTIADLSTECVSSSGGI